MNEQEIIFVRPGMEWKEKALAYKAEHFAAGESVIDGSERLDRMESYEEWLSYVTKNADPLTAAPNWVVTDTFFAVRPRDGEIIGIIDLRHTLNDFLKDLGHCGYSVRPSERKKGYATRMLKMLTEVAKAYGMSGLQLSVERGNIASVKVIKANGGRYERSFLFGGEAADVYQIRL